jgi:hypothetical protein
MGLLLVVPAAMDGSPAALLSLLPTFLAGWAVALFFRLSRSARTPSVRRNLFAFYIVTGTVSVWATTWDFSREGIQGQIFPPWTMLAATAFFLVPVMHLLFVQPGSEPVATPNGSPAEHDSAWPFSDPKNVAVFTVADIMHSRLPILRVCHDEEDGAWQFLTGDPLPCKKEWMLVALEEVVKVDPPSWIWRDFRPAGRPRGPLSVENGHQKDKRLNNIRQTAVRIGWLMGCAPSPMVAAHLVATMGFFCFFSILQHSTSPQTPRLRVQIPFPPRVDTWPTG